MIQTDDVLRATKALWDATQALATLVPGGLWDGRPEQASDTPYAVAAVEEQSAEFTSGKACLQRFTLTLCVWSDRGSANAGDIRRAIDAAIRAGLQLQRGTILHVLPAPGKAETDAATRDARDVLVTAGRWNILAQATK